MAHESLNPNGLAKPFGPFVQVTSAPAGRLVFVSGQIAIDENGEVVGAGDLEAQTRRVMENMGIALRAAGAGFEHVVKITNYVINAAEYPRVAPIREEYLKEPYPASTLIEVAGLIFPELLLEIEAVAVVADG